MSEDAEALAADLPYIHDIGLGGKLNEILNDTNESEPIATADFTFERQEGDRWTHQGFVHTVADRAALDAERAELDGRLRAALQEMKRDGWKSVSLYFEWDEPLRAVCMVETTPVKLSTEGTVDGLAAEYQRFFAERGHELRDMRAVLLPKKKGAFELKLTYVTPRASAYAPATLGGGARAIEE